MNYLTDRIFVEDIENALYERLVRGAIQQELINTFGLRGIGKTYALVKFAKKNELVAIIVGSGSELRYKSSYANVYTMKEISQRKDLIENKKVVIDEGISEKEITEMGGIIITGFTNQIKR